MDVDLAFGPSRAGGEDPDINLAGFRIAQPAASLPLMFAVCCRTSSSRIPSLPPDRRRKVRRLSGSNPNIAYPTQGVASGRPHAPVSICGQALPAQAYDSSGNTLRYDPDGTGPKPLREIAYDLENRPIVVKNNGVISTFAYGPDGERSSQTFIGSGGQ
jgi:hypothetical protein